jgi:hypothetical protein
MYWVLNLTPGGAVFGQTSQPPPPLFALSGHCLVIDSEKAGGLYLRHPITLHLILRIKSPLLI